MNPMNSKCFLVLALMILTATTLLAQEQQEERTQNDAKHNMTVPTDTKISVRSEQAIDSQNTSEGQKFPATVVQAVEGNAGEVLIPKGSPAELVIRQVKAAGTTGTAHLVLDLESVTVSGHRFQVSTQDVTESGKQGLGKNRRTGEMVGGGAVLGTVIGAIAGGGKGAAIGALAGGAAGAGTQVLTRGKDIKVPAETILNFRLEKPLHLVRAG